MTGSAAYPDLVAGRWQTLPIVEQLANVGSEVERAIGAHEAGRLDRRDHAMRRALELFDLTAADEGLKMRHVRSDLLQTPDTPAHSCDAIAHPVRSAVAGEIVAARAAGSRLATSAMLTTMAIAAPNAAGSSGLIP